MRSLPNFLPSRSGPNSPDRDAFPTPCRLIFVSNHLPLIVKRDEVAGWVFERDEDALIAQAKEGLPDDMEPVYVGCLPVEVEGHEQEVRELRWSCSGCNPTNDTELDVQIMYFSLQEVAQQLMTQFNCYPVFLGEELKTNYYKKFCKQQLEVLSSLEDDFVWIHDYHLLVLPSLLRKRFHRIRSVSTIRHSLCHIHTHVLTPH